MRRYKEQEPEKVMAYLRAIASVPKNRIAYIDETGIDSYLYREYCYAPRWQNVIGFISCKKYRRVGIVAAQVAGAILAPLQYNGTMDSRLFEAWFEPS